jgi:hypothetical protein
VSNPEKEAHQQKWREKYAGYANDFNLLLNPLRRDAIELVKESSNWGKLAVQYALIVNAGALAALPLSLLKNPLAQGTDLFTMTSADDSRLLQ